MSDFKPVMTIHPDGRITTEAPQDEVVQGVLDALQEQIQYMLKCEWNRAINAAIDGSDRYVSLEFLQRMKK
jgi:hypothetical protein